LACALRPTQCDSSETTFYVEQLTALIGVIVSRPNGKVDFDIGGAFKVAPSVGLSHSTQGPPPGSNRPD
jgi:hypothetical protein